MRADEISFDAKFREYQSYISNDNKRLIALENWQEVSAHATFALLSGDQKDKDDAQREIQKFLASNRMKDNV